MISKKSIKKFLERKLRSFDWIKNYKKDDLINELATLKPKPRFGKITPWLHQMACFLIMLEVKRFMLNLDMGSGKTLSILMLLMYRKQRGEKPRAIVFVPYLTSIVTWIDEVEDKAPNLKLVPLLGSSTENLAALQSEADLFVMCYQSAVAMVSQPVYSTKRRKDVWNFRAADVRKIFADFDMLVMDEIHRCRSPSSLTYRMCRAIAKQVDWSFGLTGTPFGKKVLALWPQYFLIDFGKTLGQSQEFFKAVFFREETNYWGGYDIKFKKRMKPDLRRMIKNCSIHYSIDELHDMPKKVYVQKNLPAPPDSEAYCKKFIEHINSTVQTKGKGSYKEVQSSYLKLRQLSSGFMTLTGDDKDKIQIEFKENPKLEALIDLIESMPSGRKMVVFHHFVYTNQLISRKLKELKIGHARIWGGARDPIGQLRKFKDDANCNILVINDQSGSSSLNLQMANYLVFFEQPDDPIIRQQAERRVWRPGQLRRCLIYDLLVRQTKDHALHKANKEGEILLKSIIAGHRKL